MSNFYEFLKSVAHNDIIYVHHILNNPKLMDFTINDKHLDAYTSLHLAVEMQHPKVVTLLLKAGANPMLCDDKGDNCLHCAIKNDSVNVASLILDSTPNINKLNEHGFAALHLAVRLKKEAMVRLLMDKNAVVNVRSVEGDTPLHIAVAQTDASMVTLLLNHRADPNQKNTAGYSPLHTCFKMKSLQVMVLLLENGGNPRVRDSDYRNALQHALLHGTLEMAEKLIEIAPVNVNERMTPESKTPLYYALSGNDSVGKIRLLVQSGADVNAKSGGETPLWAAIMRSDNPEVECLLQLGADPNAPGCYSPLYTTVEYGMLRKTQLLIDFGADIHRKDDQQRSLLHTALEYCGLESGEEDIFSYILLFAFNYPDKETQLNVVKLLLLNGLRISDKDRRHLNASLFKELENYQTECELLKVTKIHEDSPLTYYDLLTMKTNELLRYLRNERLQEALESSEYANLFRYYIVDIVKKYTRVLQHKQLLDDMQELLDDTLGHILPSELIVIICGYFSEMDLKKCFQLECYDII